MIRCSICYTEIKEADPVTGCPDCRQDYHASCWDEVGGCGTYGCRRAAIADKPPVPVVVGAGWGDSKDCPRCGKQISSSLLVCRCGARFPWADPMTCEDYQTWAAGERATAATRRRLIWMFILSLIGVTAPVVGPIAGVYAWRKRNQVTGTGGTYLAMGYASAAIGAIYAILIAVTALGG